MAMSWNEAKEILNSDPKVQKELKENEIEYTIIRNTIKARLEKKITQKELAQLIGTKQSNISRLESGEYNPTISLLAKIAKALGKTLKIDFI